MEEKGEPYKAELIKDLPKEEVISFYRQGEFTDLCAGPHLKATGPVRAVKLTSIAGAYWRGDEHNKMLTRIYGTAFPKASELEAYLARIEEAKKRDHRKPGKELGLFTLLEEGQYLPGQQTVKILVLSFSGKQGCKMRLMFYGDRTKQNICME